MLQAWTRLRLHPCTQGHCFGTISFNCASILASQSARSFSAPASASLSAKPSASSTELAHLRRILKGSPEAPSLRSQVEGALRTTKHLASLRRRRAWAQSQRETFGTANPSEHLVAAEDSPTVSEQPESSTVDSPNFVSLSDRADGAKVFDLSTPVDSLEESKPPKQVNDTEDSGSLGQDAAALVARKLRVKRQNLERKRKKKSRRALATMATQARIDNAVLFICDVQEKFRGAIWELDKVISTTQKVVKAASTLKIPIFVTTQNAARLGATVSEISSLLPTEPSTSTEIDKTAFSMMVPALHRALEPYTGGTATTRPRPLSVILVGIETHICVTQTTLDLLRAGHKVYVLADGVSSCNEAERPIALARLAREGATVTTSESLLFELLGDAKSEHFRAVSGLVKDTKEQTKAALVALGKL